MNLEDILKLYPEYNVVYGPYKHKHDKRMRIILYKSGEKGKWRKILAYAKALMEIKLNRVLEKGEVVDHIDEDKTNDNIDNLQVLSNKENIIKSNKANPSFYTRTFNKYGKVDNKKAGRKGGLANKGIPKSEAHKQAIRNAWLAKKDKIV